MNQTPTRFRRIGAALATLALVAVGLVAFPMSASAATIAVTSLLDDNSGGTLREAIVQANGTPVADTIDIQVDGVITLSSTITVTAGVYLHGATTGAGTTITRNFSGDMFTVAMATAVTPDFTTSDISFQGVPATYTGRAVNVTNVQPARNVGFYNSYFFGFKGATDGGAISVSGITGDFTSDFTDFTNNEASNYGGTIHLVNVAGAIQFSSMNMLATQAVTGGGIYIDAPGSAITLIDSDIAGGTATTDQGGGMFVDRAATLNVENSALTENTAYNAGGALAANDVGVTTISDSEIFSNTVTGNRGGGLYVGGGTATITGSTFSFNTSALGGGGIYADVTWFRMEGTSVHDNTSVSGGGVELAGFSDTSYIAHSNFYKNRARSAVAPGGLGGAISFSTATGALFGVIATTFENNEAVLLDVNDLPTAAGRGGAIYAVGTADDFVIEDSLFTDNSLGGFSGTHGVSVYVDNGEISDFFNVLNTTFDEPAPSMAIAIHGFATASAELVVAHTTFVTDFAIAILDSTTIGLAPRVTHTIFDGGAFQTVLVVAGPNVQVDWSLFGSTLALQDVTATNTAFSVPTMLLGPLQDNGGPTETRMPLPGSPAIDMGNPAAVLLPVYDQREAPFDRVVNNIVDIGAVEAEAITAALPPTGATINILIPVIGGALLLLGVGAIIFTQLRRRRLAMPAAAAPEKELGKLDA